MLGLGIGPLPRMCLVRPKATSGRVYISIHKLVRQKVSVSSKSRTLNRWNDGGHRYSVLFAHVIRAGGVPLPTDLLVPLR